MTDERQTLLVQNSRELISRKILRDRPVQGCQKARARLTMTKASDGPSLPLEHCVQTIKQHLQSASKAPPKELARLYLAAVALACHLSVDQRTLHQARYEYGISILKNIFWE